MTCAAFLVLGSSLTMAGLQTLIVGDSTSAWADYLAIPVVDVHRIDDNAQTSTHTLTQIDKYLNKLHYPDIIIWNNGLHDIARPGGSLQTDPDTYRANLYAIADRMQHGGVMVFFCLTTEVEDIYIPSGYRRNTDVITYNQIAREVMAAHGIPIIDLYQASQSIPTYDGVHYTPYGYYQLAQTVQQHIMPYVLTAQPHTVPISTYICFYTLFSVLCAWTITQRRH